MFSTTRVSTVPFDRWEMVFGKREREFSDVSIWYAALMHGGSVPTHDSHVLVYDASEPGSECTLFPLGWKNQGPHGASQTSGILVVLLLDDSECNTFLCVDRA